MWRIVRIVACLFFLALGLDTAAAAGCDDAAIAVTGARALDGDTFRTDDGQEWRLAGVLAPKRGDGARAPLDAGDGRRSRASPADDAQAALDALVLRRALRLIPVGAAADRHARRLAIARDASCRSLAERLLADGHARVYPTFVTRSLVPPLYAAEAMARAATRGLWADSRYRLLHPSEIGARFDSYVVVEERPQSVITGRAGTTLSFGDDRRRDFGVTIEPKVRKLLAAAGLEPAVLVGRRIRVRGWLRNRGGVPVIELAVPEQLEVVER
ncbi:hypothetical protein FHP25_25935 [Vineibacter terrae]|uniref:TNase-like domain-containing protein n=1 Tax=Vineibacter terrae TaxID=2586908 RepID=A0A5C8PG50_9HYPH|nr:thermonuclease family protein [Vineibacter terrae]TXL72276.1 hypothetical protein FHP25_25935 [Vineibacter terrae]